MIKAKTSSHGPSVQSTMQKWITRTSRVMTVLTCIATLSLAITAHAEDKTVTYAPEFCEFEVTFPGEPYKTERCDKGGGRCHELTSYTQVFDMAATVNFRVICNEIGGDVKDAYSQEVIEATLRAMTKQTVVKEYNVAYREGNGYKQAGLVGEGKTGRTPMIYISQMWIGEKSAMTVEAELIGDEHGEADKVFADILRSVMPIAEKPEAPEPEPEDQAPDGESTDE